jgi:predicted ATP-grasp superfamily ATP-dependent carboligase
MTKVLLVDTNLAALPIVTDLTRAGHEVHVVGSRPDDTLALMLHGRFHQLDYADPGQLQDLFIAKGFDTLVPGCNDVAYAASCQVAASLKLPGFAPFEVSAVLNNKAEFRKLAQYLGLPVPRTFTQEQASVHQGPLIIKPVDGFSGRGISVLATFEATDFEFACDRARSLSRSGRCLIEEFVPGQLFSHSGFISAQQIIQDTFVQEHCSANPFAVDTSWVDDQISPGIRAAVRDAVERLASHLNLRDGLVHTQFIVKDEQLWLIEPTLRCPGDLYSRLMELSGVENYVRNYWSPFLGLPLVQSSQGPRTQIIRHTVTFTEPGVFDGLSFAEPLEVKEFYPLSRTGAAHASAPQDRAGVLFVHCRGEQELARAAARFIDRSALDYRGLPEAVIPGEVACAS